MKKKNLINKITYVLLITMLIGVLNGCSHETVIIDEVKTPIEDNTVSKDNEIEDTQIVIGDGQNNTATETDKPLDVQDKEPAITDPVIPVSPSEEHNLFYYKKKLQNEKEKELYDAIYEGLKSFSPKISIPIINTEKISDIYEFVRMDNPQFFYCPTSFKILTTKITGTVSAIEIEFEYSDIWNEDTIANAKSEITLASNEILQQLSAIDGDYNKVLYLYMLLTKNIEYKSDEETDYSIYGALIKKRATCEGFAESFQYLLSLIDIDSLTVVGESKDQAHEWNMAKIDNQWYFFDVTWDSPTNTSKYLPYNYFALTAEDLSLSHKIYYFDYLPEANNTKYNYYYYNDLILNKFSETEVVKMSKRSYELNPNHITFRTSDMETYDEVVTNIQSWLPKVFKEIGVVRNEISYMSNTELNIIDIVLKEE